MPKGYEDEYDFLYYNTKGTIPNMIRYASDDEIEYLNTLLHCDGRNFCNGQLDSVNK